MKKHLYYLLSAICLFSLTSIIFAQDRPINQQELVERNTLYNPVVPSTGQNSDHTIKKDSVYQWITASKVTGIKDKIQTPAKFKVYQNYPNPFNPSTTIKYTLPKTSHVLISVYNSLGQLVQMLLNKNQPEGEYSVTFNASGLPSGIYFYKVKSGENIIIKKCILLK